VIVVLQKREFEDRRQASSTLSSKKGLAARIERWPMPGLPVFVRQAQGGKQFSAMQAAAVCASRGFVSLFGGQLNEALVEWDYQFRVGEHPCCALFGDAV
jgi:hypothetical protein